MESNVEEISIDPIDDLHKVLVSNGYKLPDVNKFRAMMQDAGNRQALHSNLVKAGDYTKSFGDFESQINSKKKETTTPSVSQGSTAVAEQPIMPSSTTPTNNVDPKLLQSIGVDNQAEVLNPISQIPQGQMPEAPRELDPTQAPRGTAMMPDSYFQSQQPKATYGSMQEADNRFLKDRNAIDTKIN